MTPEQLKASILQYAIQGKLVEQRAEEGTAEELYQQIQEEKQKLIKVGKIKKDKPLADITEDEIPFDISESWKWVRLSTVGITQTGNTPKKAHPEYFGNNIPFLGPGDIQNGIVDYGNQGLSEEGKKYGRITPADSILQVCIGGSIGKCALVDREVTFNQQINAIYPILVNYKYIYYVLDSYYFKKYMIDNAGGTATPIINRGLWDAITIPLPPLEEQYRIVAKIEELLPYVDRYAEAYGKLEQFNAKFPDDMKKSILQYAIQGKLVEQRPEEGTAEELYQQIQDERKNYKIKKLSLMTIDDVPFDIPETWKWIHLQDIVKKTIKRGKSPKYAEKSNVQVFAQKCNVKSGGINMELALFLDEATIEKYPKEEYMCDGDIVINSTGGGTMGRVGVFNDTDRINEMAIVPDGHVTVIRACDAIDSKYLYYFIKHNQKYLEKQGEGSTNQTELKPFTIASLALPLPPLEEQHRIVAKIEELLPYCEQLVK